MTKDKNKKPLNPARERRQILKGALGVGALAAWHKPIINSVVTPAHAQTSFCPVLVFSNISSGPLSGMTTPPVCQVTFDVLSPDATPVTIVNITDNSVSPNTMINYDVFGSDVTDTVGSRVVWQGEASDAPFCTDLMPTEDVEFTITLSCAASGGLEETQMVMLSTILGQ